MGRAIFHAVALGGAAWVGIAAGHAAGLHPVVGTLVAAALYVQARLLGRRAIDAIERRRLVRASGLTGRDASRMADALDMLDRGHPDVARPALAALAAAGIGGDAVGGAHLRACLRLAAHRNHGEGEPSVWAGITGAARRPCPYLERAILAPALSVDAGAVAAEAAVVDDATLAALVAARRALLDLLLPAVGRPSHPGFARAEQDLEGMTGGRFVLFPARRLALLAGGRPLRPRLPPREEAAVLLLRHGRHVAAAALLASADAAGALSRRGRALRTAAVMLGFLQEGSESAVSPDLFARRTREIFFLHTREIAMTWGSPHLDGLGTGPRRLLDLLREKRSFVTALAALRARGRGAGGAVALLVRRVAGGPGDEQPPRAPRRLLRWWRTEGRLSDLAVASNLRGLVLMEEGRPREAEAEFRRALALDPWFAAAAYNLGCALDEGASADVAVADGAGEDPAGQLRRIAAASGAEEGPWLLLGELLESIDRLPEAEEVYARILRRDPMHAEANLFLGRLLSEQGRLEEAEGPLRRAAASRADHPDALMALGVLHLDAGRPGEAVAPLRAAAEAATGERRDDARYLLHVAYRDAGDHERALEVLDGVPDRVLRRSEQMLEEAALYLEERQRFDRSQRLFERLRELRARRGEW